MSDETYLPQRSEHSTPGPGDLPDRGPALLDKIQADLQMDDEWIVRTSRDLTWWGDALPLTFTVDAPHLVQGDPTIKLTIATAVLTDVEAPTSAVVEVLDQLNRTASTGAFVWLEDERRVDAFLTHYAYAGVAAITHAMSAYALLLYGEALGQAQYLAEQIGGNLAIIAHPMSGVREDYDEMLTFTQQAVLPAGQEPNRWHGLELPALAEHLTSEGIGISTGGPDGLSVEYSLAGNSTETALQQLLCLEHPAYGAGLMSLLRLPLTVGDEAPTVANDLNLGEYLTRTGVTALGAWCTDRAGGIAQTTFIPNYHHTTWVAPNLAYWAAAHARVASETFTPNVTPDERNPS